MKIIVTAPGFPPAYLGGGPIRTLESMIRAGDGRHETYVLTNNFDLGATEPLVADGDRWVPFHHAQVMYLEPGWRGVVRALTELRRAKPDVVYLNSLFYFRLSVAVQAASLVTGQQLAIAPRGELDPGALRLKPKKKRLYLGIVKRLGITRRAIWHASSELEVRNIESALGHPVQAIVRSNDTQLPLHAPEIELRDSGPLRMVFLSRLSRKKGLHILLDSLKDCRHQMTLDIIGPGEDDRYLAECQRLADFLPEHIGVQFLGAIPPEQTRSHLLDYDLFVLPTASENFGHVIAEALSVSVPVMCADVTPWTSVLQSGGGVVVNEHATPEWTRLLDDYAALGADGWLAHRAQARGAYDVWRARQEELPHFFDLLGQALKAV